METPIQGFAQPLTAALGTSLLLSWSQFSQLYSKKIRPKRYLRLLILWFCAGFWDVSLFESRIFIIHSFWPF